MIKLFNHFQLAQLRVMFDEVKRLLDDLIYVCGVLFSLALVRELKQAVGDRLAAKRFVPDYLQVLAEVFVKRRF